MPVWIEGRGWEDDKDRYLFTEREFRRIAWLGFALGALSFSVLFVAIGRASVGWF